MNLGFETMGATIGTSFEEATGYRQRSLGSLVGKDGRRSWWAGAGGVEKQTDGLSSLPLSSMG